jgi:hypothetical protein
MTQLGAGADFGAATAKQGEFEGEGQCYLEFLF